MTATRVTVVIPTRERPDTFSKCLQTVINQDYPNLEIIVSDNFSGPETAAIVEAVHDPRIRYLNTGRRLSMSHNYEFALSHIDEGWVVNVGDDDGLLPNALGRMTAILEKTGCEALSSENCTYSWPSQSKTSGSILTVPLGRGYEVVDAKAAMRRIMDWSVHSLILPQIYTGGMVSVSLIKKIKEVKGSFFQSQIPDIYSGFAICSVIDRYVYSREPFAVAGASKHSSGSALFAMKSTPFLLEDNIAWHPAIPLPSNGTFTFSMPAIACESYLQSAYLHGNFAGLTPEDHMSLILDQTDVGRELLDDRWQQSFATRHGFDYRMVASRARHTPLRRRISTSRAVIQNYLGRYRIDHSSGLPVNDVFEASLVADTVLKLRPNRLRSLLKTFRRKALGNFSPRHGPPKSL
ncbi:MAG: hypothetical protein NVS3B5_09410 [Sphingomicrobium sp.]